MEGDLLTNSLKRLEQTTIALTNKCAALGNEFEKATSVLTNACAALENQLSKEKAKNSEYRKRLGKRLVALENRFAEAEDETSFRKGKSDGSHSSSDSSSDSNDDDDSSDDDNNEDDDEDVSRHFNPKWPKIPNHDENKARIMCPCYCHDDSVCTLFTATDRLQKTITDAGFIKMGRNLESEINSACKAEICCHTAFTISKDLTKKLEIPAKNSKFWMNGIS